MRLSYITAKRPRSYFNRSKKRKKHKRQFSSFILLHLLVYLLVVRLLLLQPDELPDAIVHLLDGLELREAHALAVRDVVEAALGLGVLAGGAADLEMKRADEMCT